VKMDLKRKIAIIVGVLFAIVIMASMILGDSDYLDNVSLNENLMWIGTPFEFTLAIVIACIPILLYPILKKHNVSMAIGFVGAPLAVRFWGHGVFAPVVFSFGSLMFYYLLGKSKLIPRWLSGWGIIGAILFLASAFLPLFGYGSRSNIVLLHLTGGVNQMVLAVWLIVKGFNSSTIDS
jgi:hypothetical protein